MRYKTKAEEPEAPATSWRYTDKAGNVRTARRTRYDWDGLPCEVFATDEAGTYLLVEDPAAAFHGTEGTASAYTLHVSGAVAKPTWEGDIPAWLLQRQVPAVPGDNAPEGDVGACLGWWDVQVRDEKRRQEAARRVGWAAFA